MRIEVIFLDPLVAVAFHNLGNGPDFFSPFLAWLAVLQALLLFLLIYIRFRFRAMLVWRYAIRIEVFIWLAFRSLFASWRATAGWKDRDLPTPTLRL